MNTTQNSAQEHNLQPFLFKLVLNMQCNAICVLIQPGSEAHCSPQIENLQILLETVCLVPDK